jgi:hypothetical protein
MYHKLEPIYYNLSQIVGHNNTIKSNPTPAFIEELNNQLILNNSKEYYVSIARTTIPTNDIPLWIASIEDGILQNDINKLINNFTMSYNDPSGNPLITKRMNVNFISQIMNPSPVGQNSFSYPYPPSQNQGNQDTSTRYYWVYDIELVLQMFNRTLRNLYIEVAGGANSLYGETFNLSYYPYISFDNNNRCFSINIVGEDSSNNNYFNQTGFYGNPKLSLYQDQLTSDFFGFNARVISVDNTNQLLLCFDIGNNSSVKNNGVYYKMTSSQSNLNMWSSFNKIIIGVSYGISTIQEYDSVPLRNSQGSNSNSGNFSKPSIPMLTDLETNKDEWSINRNYIQFTSSNISQTRLISMNGGMLQSFQVSVYWLDNFGNRQQLYLPEGIPLTMKLAFYPKTTTLI